MTDAARFPVLDEYLGSARLAPYRRACAGDSDRARRLYVWNIEISAAFWGPIHGIEIAIRNAVHAALAEHFQRADWWNAAAIDTRIGQKARAQERELSTTSSPVRADDVVAALSFGFWSAVLASPKNALEQHRYWQQCLHRAFPGWSHKPNDAATRKAFT